MNAYKENNRRRQWSNLPQDLLNLIIKKLYFVDRIRFRAVCKDWHIPIGSPPDNELPWVMNYTPSDLLHETKVMLSDPFHKKTHKIPNLAGIDQGNFLSYFECSRICASKNGWLLLANCKVYIGIDLYLYSPFTNNVIMLPTLFTTLFCEVPSYDKATFSSSNPKCLDCVFVVAHCNQRGGLKISTYRNGDNEWRNKILDVDSERPVASLVCTEKGICYFVLECGKLGVFCVESQEWSWLLYSVWNQQDWIAISYMHLVELNGDLLVAKCWSTYNCCEVLRYDENERDWIEHPTLGDKALFICPCSSYLRPAVGDTTGLANKIIFLNYHRNVNGIRVYSLKNGSWKKSRAYDWVAQDSLQNLLIEPPY